MSPVKPAAPNSKEDALLVAGRIDDLDAARQDDEAIERLVARRVEILARLECLGPPALPRHVDLEGIELGESDSFPLHVGLA